MARPLTRLRRGREQSDDHHDRHADPAEGRHALLRLPGMAGTLKRAARRDQVLELHVCLL
jgi:hypothetical protein